MEYSMPFISRPVQVRAARSRFDARWMLAILLAILFSGLFQIISQTSRFTLWGIWLLIWWLVIWNYSPANLSRLWKPALPLVVWFAVYGIWGAIASPIPVFAVLGRDFFRLLTIMMMVAVLTADRVSLRRFAYLIPWVLFLNLVVSIAFLERLPLAQFLLHGDFANAETQILDVRYAGLWGNANFAGMNTLILLVLSAYGRGWLIRLGRAAGVGIIYLTASRTSTYLLLLIGLLFLYNHLRYNPRARQIIVGCVIALAVVWLSGVEFRAMLPEEGAFGRVFDPLQVNTEAAGEETRLNVMEEWLPVLERGPWYGYGYGVMGGGAVMGTAFSTDIPYYGTHNMYLGTCIEDGFFGGISFLVLLGFGLLAALRARLAPNDQTVVLALWLVAIVFSAFAHSLQTYLDGCAMYLLCFLLPGSTALRSASQERRRHPGRGNGSSCRQVGRII